MRYAFVVRNRRAELSASESLARAASLKSKVCSTRAARPLKAAAVSTVLQTSRNYNSDNDITASSS